MTHRVALSPLIAAAVMLGAGNAHADDLSYHFLHAVESKGLTQYFASPDVEISEAQAVCAGLRTRGNPESMAFLIARNRHMNKAQVEDFIDTSVNFYCPDLPRPQF